VGPPGGGSLSLTEDGEPGAPPTFPPGPPVPLVEREDHVEEAHGMAGGVEVCPARVDPAAVGLLGGEEVVDGSPHRGGESVLGENAVATDQHQGAEGRYPDGALGSVRLGRPAAVGVLAGHQRAVLVTEVAQGLGVEEDAERVRHQLEVLWPRRQAPARALAYEEAVLVADQPIDARALRQRVTSAEARR